MKSIVTFLTLMLVLFGGLAMAADNDGYFAQSTAQTPKTILGGPVTNPGPAVEIASVTLEHQGNFLITARVDGQSYGPNSGAVCFITTSTDPYGVQNMSQTVNTSSDWTKQVNVNYVLLGKATGISGKVTLSCQKGYLFTNSSLFWGTLMLVQVDEINPH
ncbi:exported hypothetical protein [Candidatus Sulfopaludibacter sp. SbA4]|nr:exported hypothetical protein [Candidatus Sulfopaludibacter sp. SbA4]